MALPRPPVAETEPQPPLLFGTDFIVLAVDAHNGLQMHDNFYTGLQLGTPNGRTMYYEYCSLMEELSCFSQVVYHYSDCPERFQTNQLLEKKGA
ncbi:MAG: hypothetical protein ACKPKO_65550, partial [Candidatus Fonsibacter sp.]